MLKTSQNTFKQRLARFQKYQIKDLAANVAVLCGSVPYVMW